MFRNKENPNKWTLYCSDQWYFICSTVSSDMLHYNSVIIVRVGGAGVYYYFVPHLVYVSTWTMCLSDYRRRALRGGRRHAHVQKSIWERQFICQIWYHIPTQQIHSTWPVTGESRLLWAILFLLSSFSSSSSSSFVTISDCFVSENLNSIILHSSFSVTVYCFPFLLLFLFFLLFLLL